MSETPMILQYRNVKDQHGESILFFRMGDFYEMFFEDAHLASRVLGIALTSRNKGVNAVPMAGVPVKSAETYLRKLIEMGYKVAICEQVQDPQEADGLVDRDVVRIITPGTITEDEVLADKSNNFLLSLNVGKKMTGIAWIDISTGPFCVHEIESRFLEDEITRIAPAECLIAEDQRNILIGDSNLSLQQLLQLVQVPITARPYWLFDGKSARQFILEHFQVASLEAYGCEKLEEALGAAGALIHYLQETQKTDLLYIDHIEKYNSGETMSLDRATRNCLEIQISLREHRKKDTLISVLDQTCTAMGGRLLLSWISAPLIIPNKIRSRQEGIRELVEKPQIMANLRSSFSEIQDLERLGARLAFQRSNARELLSLKKSLQAVPLVYELLTDCNMPILQEIRQELVSLEDLTCLLEKAIHLDPKPGIKEGGIIREGYNVELDEIRNLQNSGDAWMQRFEQQEIHRTGIPSLKVGFNKVFGYYIEITHAHSHKVPGDYIRKQTIKNAERYITPELKEYEGKILSAAERCKSLEYDLFMDIRERVVKYLPGIRKVAQAIARIDVLTSLAKVARDRNYVCPEIDASNSIDIVAGKHPVLDTTLGNSFVPNDLNIGPGKEMAIITGPNMAGKSTYIRQSALIVLLAQIGSFVPAQRARMGIVDRIFTRIGSADEIARGRSTFLVEMLETANILNNATANSFIILDEVGRGTSTFDGISLSWAIMEHIQKNIRARTLFATHYHEIAELSQIYPNICNYNVAVKEWRGEIAFLYQIVQGSADRSYGIYVARLAGIPKLVIQRAQEILKNLEQHAVDFQTYTKRCFRNNKPAESLFAFVGQDILETLANVDLNLITPLEAMQILQELQREAKKI